ncbi:hypothetical protein NDU88_001295 [Pleurodeles waltl]|uniref:Uncharacterized protein n=1 Tax=Pleurodeles waltl TaxID=8319 RepID=A0AAV7RCK9_PLEWA|nr:hypothetical protein NDU88_001295 [Pleurodeles waltl]
MCRPNEPRVRAQGKGRGFCFQAGAAVHPRAPPLDTCPTGRSRLAPRYTSPSYARRVKPSYRLHVSSDEPPCPCTGQGVGRLLPGRVSALSQASRGHLLSTHVPQDAADWHPDTPLHPTPGA